MQALSPCRAKLRVTAGLAASLALWSCDPVALATDLGDQASLVKAAALVTAQDRELAESMAAQARQRTEADKRRLGAPDWGPLSKLWCEAVLIAPAPENLVECARSRFAAVSQMSNPQPSLETVRLQRARESLVMVRAALEIAGGEPALSDTLRLRLRHDAQCLRAVVAGTATPPGCEPSDNSMD